MVETVMPTVTPPKNRAQASRLIVWSVILGYAFFLVGSITYQNYKLNKQIDVEKAHLTDLQKQNKLLQLSLFYYKSSAYKEVQARRLLNLKGPDEHVVALPQASTEPVLSVASLKPRPNDTPRLSPVQAWWDLFFGKST